MANKRLFSLFCSFILLFLLLIIIRAGTTGKIQGHIIDTETGEPLIGVNVIVEGANIGAASDLEGNYTILNIPPGTYEVRFSSIGYADLVKRNVRVDIDQTTRVNAEMRKESIQGEEVVVIAKRDLVKKDVATSVSSVESNEIENMPISSINEAVELQAGVGEGLVIRGGDANEGLFQMDGITLRDPRNNQPISNLPISSVKEISIEKGGFSAEYGQVRSGIVNVITKEGSKTNYNGKISLQYAPPQKKHFGISPYHKNSMWMRPYLDPDVCWQGTENGSWDLYTQRQYPSFDGWNKISRRTLENDDPSDDLSPKDAQRVWKWLHRRRPVTDQPDYNFDAGFGGPVPYLSKKLGNLRFFTSFRKEKEMLLIPLSRDDYQSYNGTLKLTSDLSKSTKLQLSGLIGTEYNVAINRNDINFYNKNFGINGYPRWLPTNYVRSPLEIPTVTAEQRATRIFTNSWYSQAELSHYSMAAKITHTISNNSFYEVKLEHMNRSYQTGPIADRDTTRKYEIVPGYSVSEAPFGYSPELESGIAGMFLGGHSSTARDSSSNASTSLKFDYTNQINFNNQIKLGLDFSYYNLNFDFGYTKPALGSNRWVDKKENPFRISAYIQDKYEAEGFIVNLGLRLDYSNPNTEWAYPDKFNQDFFGAGSSEEGDYEKKEVEPDYALSPRLGISHPITANSKLYFNYGHFKQMPAYEQAFRTGRNSAGSVLYYGDPGLKQALTVSYELGYDHVLFENFVVKIAGYYNDTKNQVDFTEYRNALGTVNYQYINNNSYEDVRGLEITLRKKYGGWLRGFVNYTYQVNSSGRFGTPLNYEIDSEEQEWIEQNWDQLFQNKPLPRPYLNANITFLTPHNFGPKFLGLDILANWSINFLGRWEAGEWLTYNPLGIDIENNLQVTDYYNVDLRINKNISTKIADITVFALINNLFNIKKLSGASFYDVHDYRYYMRSLHLPDSEAYDNIVGDDKPGDYRKSGVEYQPIEQVGNVMNLQEISDRAIYYDTSSEQYMDYVNGEWREVEDSKMDQILEDKAYIDMPNQSSFNFLNPRQIFMGIRVSFKIQ